MEPPRRSLRTLAHFARAPKGGFRMSTVSLPSLIQSPQLLVHPQVVHGFTTRHGGVGSPPFDTLNMGLHVRDNPDDVVENRHRVCRALGFSLEAWVSGEQVHGAEVAMVGPEAAGRGSLTLSTAISGVDGLITNAAGILLAAYFADCVPVFFVDPEIPAIGIAHAGWRGTLGGVVDRMVEQFRLSFGTPSERLHVWLGPAIGPCCYQVDSTLANQFRHIAEGFPAPIIRENGGTYWLDLRLANRLRLQNLGVLPDAMDTAPHCTGCDTEQFFSHRVLGPTTGRMAGLIGILPSAIRQDSAPDK